MPILTVEKEWFWSISTGIVWIKCTKAAKSDLDWCDDGGYSTATNEKVIDEHVRQARTYPPACSPNY